MDDVKVIATDTRLPEAPRSNDERSYSELLPLRSFLSADPHDSKATEQLDYIYQQLNTDGKLPVGELLNQLKHIEQKLGAPKLGETRFGKIFNYLKAVSTVKHAEQIRDAYLA